LSIGKAMKLSPFDIRFSIHSISAWDHITRTEYRGCPVTDKLLFTVPSCYFFLSLLVNGLERNFDDAEVETVKRSLQNVRDQVISLLDQIDARTKSVIRPDDSDGKTIRVIFSCSCIASDAIYFTFLRSGEINGGFICGVKARTFQSPVTQYLKHKLYLRIIVYYYVLHAWLYMCIYMYVIVMSCIEILYTRLNSLNSAF
jgi:hypothetical protein